MNSHFRLPGRIDLMAASNQLSAIPRANLTEEILKRIISLINDLRPGDYTDHIVLTYTASAAEVASARNFALAGSLASE